MAIAFIGLVVCIEVQIVVLAFGIWCLQKVVRLDLESRRAKEREMADRGVGSGGV